MFHPQYTITPTLLADIKEIATLVFELNQYRLPEPVAAELSVEARVRSTSASTSIEGNPLSLTDVKALLRKQPAQLRDSQREVLNYNRALEILGRDKQGELAMSLVLETQRLVTEGLLQTSRCGKLRREPVFVNDPRSGLPIFLPPDHDDVPRLMEELIVWVNDSRRQELDPIIIAGVFHKQFVIIHPFMDGNGRTTRLLTKVLLAQLGLDLFSLVSFENFYNQNITRYFQAVGELGDYYEVRDDINFTPWLEYFAEGIIDELFRLRTAVKARLAKSAHRLKPHHELILQFLQEHGSITTKQYAQITDRKTSTRAKDLSELVNMELIRRVGRTRSVYYELVEGWESEAS